MAARRLASLSRRPPEELVPGLLAELGRSESLPLMPPQRLALLRRLKALTRDAINRLPKTPGNGPARRAGTQGLTTEQELMRLMTANFKQFLRDLDRPKFLHFGQWDMTRQWARANLMSFLGQQICYAARAQRPLPQGAWQDLHDLFVYLVLRNDLPLERPPTARQQPSASRFETAYKRLLWLGLVQSLRPSAPVDRQMWHQTASWALDSWLIEPESVLGCDGLILVEVAKDAPPRLELRSLDDPFHGWALSPALAFLDHLRRAGQPGLATALKRYSTDSLAA